MNSTERAEAARLGIESFFDRMVAPLSEKFRAQGVQIFPPGPEPACGSYYIARRQPAMSRGDFESPSCVDFDDFSRRIKAQWMAQGREDLAGLAEELGTLARVAYNLDEAGTEVSPFVYVMF